MSTGDLLAPSSPVLAFFRGGQTCVFLEDKMLKVTLMPVSKIKSLRA